MDVNILDPRSKRHDLSDFNKQHNFITLNFCYRAIITETFDDIKDKYTVDVYDNGFIIGSDSTRAALEAYVSDSLDSYFVGDHVRVRILNDNSCLILSEKVPQLVKVVNSGPDGESDFTTNQYWGSFAYISNTDSDPDATPAIPDVYALDSAFWAVVSFTNLGEEVSEHGALALDKFVYITWEWDQHSPDRLKRWLLPIPILGNSVKYVTLTNTGGSNGSVSGSTVTNASYVYSLYDPDVAETVATGISPSGNREQGPLVGPASIGLAKKLSVGWNLIWCDERRAVVACAAT